MNAKVKNAILPGKCYALQKT